MKFETIIFLVIAFNVVSALVKRRAKKNQAAKDTSAQPSRMDPRNASVSRSPEQNDRGAEKTRSEIRRPTSVTLPSPNPMPPSQNKSRGLGQDILDQLAKEMGLRLPRPAPEPVILPKNPEANPVVMRPAAKTSTDVATPAEAPKPAIHAAVATVRKEARMELPLNDLYDPKRVRTALVLREILDPPVALRKK